MIVVRVSKNKVLRLMKEQVLDNEEEIRRLKEHNVYLEWCIKRLRFDKSHVVK